MLDTIRLRLYGILDTRDTTLSVIQKENGLDNYVTPEHNELYLKILKYRKKNFSMAIVYNRQTHTTESLTQEEFIKIQNSQKLNKHYQVRNMVKFIEEGKVKEQNLRIHGKYRVASSFSDVAFTVNENGSFMDFEFSIPKYIYGHNLAEFIPQQGSDLRYKEGTKLFNFETQAKYLFPRLNTFIDKFFSDLCGFFGCDVLPNRNYIEIRRLDFCYNQYYQTKEEAFLALEQKRKLNMKRQRKNANIAKSYDTALSYVGTSGSYFKIYHKGSEYSKSEGDLKKHLEINNKFLDGLQTNERYALKLKRHKKEIEQLFKSKGKGERFIISENHENEIKELVKKVYPFLPYKIDFLKKEMDKVLRYEVSLSSKFFASCYKRKVFRRNSDIHTTYFDAYKETKSKMDSRTSSEKPIKKKERKNYKMFHEWLNRSVSLVLSDSKTLKRYELKADVDYREQSKDYNISRFEYKYTILGGKDVGMFSEYFLMECVKHFKDLIFSYEIKKIEPFEDIITRIHEHNSLVEERVKEFNALNERHCLDDFGNYKRKKNGTKITKATQALKQSELRYLKLKKVNVNLLTVFIKEIDNGKSLSEIFKELKTPSSTKSRIKADLEMFQVFDQSLKMDILINERFDFFQYYWNTDGEIYRSKFYTQQKHFNYDNYKTERPDRKTVATA